MYFFIFFKNLSVHYFQCLRKLNIVVTFSVFETLYVQNYYAISANIATVSTTCKLPDFNPRLRINGENVVKNFILESSLQYFRKLI